MGKAQKLENTNLFTSLKQDTNCSALGRNRIWIVLGATTAATSATTRKVATLYLPTLPSAHLTTIPRWMTLIFQRNSVESEEAELNNQSLLLRVPFLLKLRPIGSCIEIQRGHKQLQFSYCLFYNYSLINMLSTYFMNKEKLSSIYK